MDTSNIKLIGRTFTYDDVLWLSYSGCGIEFTCSGGFTMKLRADRVTEAPDAPFFYARYGIFRNGELIVCERLEEQERTVKAEGLGTNVYRIVKLSESNDSSLGIVSLEAENIAPTPEKQLKIEFIGDSITCGYGVEGSLSEVYTTATENVTKAWAYLTAGKLDADYSIVSKSGAGIISGYTGDGVRNTDNLFCGYYDRMGCSVRDIDAGLNPSEIPYDFHFDPDIVFVNLGTNDMSYCYPFDETGKLRITEDEALVRRRLFYSEYKNFIMTVREKYPVARIVCMLGVMGTRLNPEVETAVQELVMAGDQRVYSLMLEDQDPEDGYGTDFHPSPVTQEKLAETVYGFASKLIK